MLPPNDGQPAAVATSTDDPAIQAEPSQGPSVTDSPVDDAVTSASSAQSEVTDLPEATVSSTTETAADIPAATTADAAADGTAEAESVQPDGQQVQRASPSESVQDPAAAADAANASNIAALIAVRCFPAPLRIAKVLCTIPA